MEEDNEVLMLIWKQCKHRRTIPYHPLTNTPSFMTAPALRIYRAFAALCEAAEAQYYCWEHVLQMPGQLYLDNEFMAEENLHTNIQRKAPSASEGAMSNGKMVQRRNHLSGKESKMEAQMTRMGPLTFDVNPQLEEYKHVYLAAVDDQAKLMHWHYRLGHLSFSKLKQLVLNDKIPQCLAKVKPPACMRCLFSAMTKVPWKGQERPSPTVRCLWQQKQAMC
jgi:hypothetical protein